jgi:hypothetical protein
MAEEILLTIFTALESAHFYSAFLPSVFTIKKFAESDKEKVRAGYIPATLLTLGLGLVVSKLINDMKPFYASILITIGMISVYELALGGWL